MLIDMGWDYHQDGWTVIWKHPQGIITLFIEHNKVYYYREYAQSLIQNQIDNYDETRNIKAIKPARLF